MSCMTIATIWPFWLACQVVSVTVWLVCHLPVHQSPQLSPLELLSSPQHSRLSWKICQIVKHNKVRCLNPLHSVHAWLGSPNPIMTERQKASDKSVLFLPRRCFFCLCTDGTGTVSAMMSGLCYLHCRYTEDLIVEFDYNMNTLLIH